MHVSHRFSVTIFLFLAIFFCSLPVFSQTEAAAISGRVADPQGLAVAGATISAINTSTNVATSTQTNGAGFYNLSSLIPGTYRVIVEKEGFAQIVKPDVQLHVQDNAGINFSLQVGSITQSVTVEGGAPLINTTDASVSTVIDRHFVESLPLNGRTFNTLLQLTPGVVIAQANPLGQSSPGQFSIAGQRTDANSFTVDGVSANFGVSTTGGESGTGGAQALSAVGGTSSLVSVEALQEFRVETSSFAPEFGRTPGGQVILTTRSGTNEFHGGIYEYFRNDVMDANDWFANAASRPRAPERHNDFGGFLGGPIWKDKTFFFLSYEGARLRLPATSMTQVPSVGARDASPQLAPYLKAYPVPNGPVSPDGFTAQFTGTYSNMATLDATSIRIDHSFSDRFSLFGRFNDAPSQTKNRTQVLSDIETQPVNTRTLTIGFNAFPNSRIANVIRGNYSTQVAHDLFALSSFGGAVPLEPSLLIGSLPADNSVGAFNTFDTGTYSIGPNQRNRTRQLNFVDDLSITVGLHQLKVGGDYRAIFLNTNHARNLIEPISFSVQGLLATSSADFLFSSIALPSQILSQSFSLYAQDSWRPTQRLALTYGVRWELAPAPSAQGNTTLASWTNVEDAAKIALAPSGTPLWATTYGNFAPRVGAAYSLTEKGDFVLRAGWGIFYDLGVGSSSDLALDFPNSATGFFSSIPLPLSNVGSFLPTISRQPPFSSFVKAFSPNLKLPRSYQWNVALDKSFGSHGLLSATYVGQHGTDLLRQSSQFQPNPNFQSDFVLTENDASSNYNAVQLQYRRPLAKGLQALLNYSWSHSIDEGSNDVVAGLAHTIIAGASDRGSSSFDVRHSFSDAFTWNLPFAAGPRPVTLLTEGWSLDAMIVARSGFPFNGSVLSASPDLGGFALSRPDLVPGQPLWIQSPMAPGGQILNSSAFSTPSPIRQGTEGRNDIPGFGLTQVDLSFGRRFPITERLSLQFRADAFNLFNHPNFTNPLGFFDLGAQGLQSTQMLNQGLGGLNPLFQEGGPRSLQLSLKLSF